ncbi:hypothetical protein KP509_1Z253300 [Ceratopteris richardii]|nr:hypothetical protein KP509_1Z253300 [Ceratopteris richardii]
MSSAPFLHNAIAFIFLPLSELFLLSSMIRHIFTEAYALANRELLSAVFTVHSACELTFPESATQHATYLLSAVYFLLSVY